MFNVGASQPECASGTFIVEAATRVNGDLSQRRVLDVGFGGPEPAIFKVEPRCRGYQVHGHVGSNVVAIHRRRHRADTGRGGPVVDWSLQKL